MAGDVVIRAEGLSKKYTIRHETERQRYTALRDVVARSPRNLWKWAVDIACGRVIVGGQATEEFWALKDVNFEVKHGEVLGIIGRNGAGKSTLLKILSRITEPTLGRVTVRGRVASLLEVGTGFHPELTGRENIYLNGAILGMSRAEIRRKFDEIVAFAEVEKFIDTPVKRYSSGMYVRLAFGVAAHLEPEVFIVDEVLAVGDADFQKKCLGKMEEVSRGQGRTVLFVSHNLAAVESLCSRCIWLEQGEMIANDRSVVVTTRYVSQMRRPVTQNLSEIVERDGDGRTRFTDISFMDAANRVITSAASGDALKLKLVTTGFIPGASCRISVSFATVHGYPLFICSSELTYGPYYPANAREVICQVPRLPLSQGTYRLTLFLEQNGIVSDWVTDAVEIYVENRDFFGLGKNAPIGWDGRTVLVDHVWENLPHEPLSMPLQVRTI